MFRRPIRPFASRSKPDVVLITHGSQNNFKFLPSLSNLWTGPIELIIYDDGCGSALTLKAQSLLRSIFNSNPALRKRVNVHVVTPECPYYSAQRIAKSWRGVLEKSVSAEQSNSQFHSTSTYFRCSNAQSEVNFGQSEHNRSPYPANLLRNVGRIAAINDYRHHLVLDMDVLPSAQLFERLSDLLDKYDADLLNNTALVLPTFETNLSCVSDVNNLPLTKTTLHAAMREGTARPFYLNVNRKVQKVTDYHKWFALDSTSSGLSLAYRVDWQIPYEPYVVIPSHAPLFDQRFVAYGVNRLSQLAEMHRQNYDFIVLDNAFVVHCGFKEHDQFHRGKQQQLRDNQALLNQILLHGS